MASRVGLERELRAARRIAEEGRIKDAFERVREREGPPRYGLANRRCARLGAE